MRDLVLRLAIPLLRLAAMRRSTKWIAWCVTSLLRARDDALRLTRLVRGGRLLCRLDDIMQLNLFFFGTVEPRTEQLILRRLGPGDVFIDAGANIGLFSVLAARAVGPSGTVVAVEPVPFNHQQLAANLALNGLSNVEVDRRALWVEPTTVSISGPIEGYRHSGAFTMATNLLWGGRMETYEVEATTLDDIVRDHGIGRVDFIKMDIEGAEGAAIRGASRLLGVHRPDIVVEVRSNMSVELGFPDGEMFDELIGYGYRCWAIDEDYMHAGRAGRPLREIRSAAELPDADNLLFTCNGDPNGDWAARPTPSTA